MRFTEKLWRHRRLPSGNFSLLLGALAASSDEAISEFGSRARWIEPVSDLSVWSDPRSSSPRYARATLELLSPVVCLLRQRDPRLCRLLLRRDMLPAQPIFEGHPRPSNDRDFGSWSEALREAFALADADSARAILSFDPDLSGPYRGDTWSLSGPLFAMASSQAEAPASAWESTFSLACELALSSGLHRVWGRKEPKTRPALAAFRADLATFLLPACARAGNLPLAEALLGAGARPGELALAKALEAFEPELLFSLLALVREDPERARKADSICSFGEPYRDGWRAPDPADRLPFPELAAQSISSALRSLFGDGSLRSEPHPDAPFFGLGPEILSFLERALEDGLQTRSEPDPAALDAFRRSLARSCAGRSDLLGAPWAESLRRHLPSPDPLELLAYLDSEQALFPERAAAASGWSPSEREAFRDAASRFFSRRLSGNASEADPALAERAARRIGALPHLLPQGCSAAEVMPTTLHHAARSALEAAFLDGASHAPSAPSRKFPRSV